MKETHDYSALDAALEAKKQEALQLVHRQRARASIAYAKSALFASAAAALLILSIAAAWWLLREAPKSPDSADPVNEQILKLADTAVTSGTTTEGRTISTSFTVFQRVDISDTERVVTGWNYEPEEIEKPKAQYCFWRETLEGFESRRVDLGLWTADSGIEWAPVQERYRAYAANCQWKLDE